jgi:hypothetical protein
MRIGCPEHYDVKSSFGGPIPIPTPAKTSGKEEKNTQKQ